MARASASLVTPGWAPRWPHRYQSAEDIRLIERAGEFVPKVLVRVYDGLKEHQQAIELAAGAVRA